MVLIKLIDKRLGHLQDESTLKKTTKLSTLDMNVTYK